MADQVRTESGGGEGAPATGQPAAVEEVKAVASTEQIPPAEPTVEVKPEESKEPKAQKVTAAEAPKVVKPETPFEANSGQPAEVKIDQTSEVPSQKPEAPTEIKQEISVLENKAQEMTQIETRSENGKVEANGVEKITSDAQGDWQQRESDLLKKIEELEKVKEARTQDSLLLELKVREEEIDLLKARVKNLETELQAALSKPSGKNHEMIENIKQQHEELLSKARGMIFDKTKMVKNQELQIEALTTQIQSLKDINQITKDLLEIRNSEVKAMEDRLQAMEARFKAEKDRYGLVLERAQTSSNINDDLRKEYETQLKLFKELREKYDQRVQALVSENERLKASLNPAGGAAPGTSG